MTRTTTAPRRKRATSARELIPNPEHNIQASLIEFTVRFAGRYPELALIYAVPNGGLRHPLIAEQMVEEGAKSGVPDLHLPVARHGFHSFYIEMKTLRGTLSKEQEWWRDQLRAQGHKWEMYRSWQDAAREMLIYLGYDPKDIVGL